MIHGNLDRLHVGDLLQWLQMGGASGRLVLSCPRGDRRFDFKDGRIFFVSSTLPDERLGSWLAARGAAPADALRRLLARSMLRRALFTDLLLQGGTITPEELRVALTELAETLASRLLVTAGVEFRFETDFQARDVLGFNLSVQPNRLLMEAARRTDEAAGHEARAPQPDLPVAGEAFENLFWELVRSGVTAAEPISGDELSALHDQIRDILGALSQWLASSPGLVPLPRSQAESAVRPENGGHAFSLFGLPQATWNQMVLSRSIHDPADEGPTSLGELERDAEALGSRAELLAAAHLQRPDAPKLDAAIRELVATWSRSAGAAAPHLGVTPDAAALAVHVVAVPTDLVLLVLATLPVPHRSLRAALLELLPRRVGSCLARLAGFSSPIRAILDPRQTTPLGLALQIGRGVLPVAGPWPVTVPDAAAAASGGGVASAEACALAADAARRAMEEAVAPPQG